MVSTREIKVGETTDLISGRKLTLDEFEQVWMKQGKEEQESTPQRKKEQ